MVILSNGRVTSISLIALISGFPKRLSIAGNRLVQMPPQKREGRIATKGHKRSHRKTLRSLRSFAAIIPTKSCLASPARV
jgi:hypothetical protein